MRRRVTGQGDLRLPQVTDIKQVILSVKAGANIHRAYVHDLRDVVEHHGADIGVLITMEKPTKPMREEAASAGFYQSPWGTHARAYRSSPFLSYWRASALMRHRWGRWGKRSRKDRRRRRPPGRTPNYPWATEPYRRAGAAR